MSRVKGAKFASEASQPNGPPEGWYLVELSELLQRAVGGGTPSTREPSYWDGDIPWTTSAQIEGFRVGTASKFITDEGVRHSAANVVPAQNVLVGSRVGVGKVAINEIDIAISQDLTGLVLRRELVNVEFLAFALMSATAQKQILGQRRGTTIAGIPRKDLLRIKLPLPPIPEQRAIAHTLRSVQRAKEQTEQVITGGGELKRSLMRHLFMYGLTTVGATSGLPLKETEIGTIPAHWLVVRLADVVEMKYGYRTSIPNKAPPAATEIISTAEISSDGALNLSHIRKVAIPQHLVERYTIREDDVLFNWRNAQKHVGKTAVVDFSPQRPTIFASFLLRLRTGDEISPRYLHNLLTCLRHRGVFFRLSRRAVNQANFNANELGDLVIPVPSPSEQQAITSLIERTERKIGAEEQRRDALDQLFKALLHELMTGRIRLTDWAEGA